MDMMNNGFQRPVNFPNVWKPLVSGLSGLLFIFSCDQDDGLNVARVQVYDVSYQFSYLTLVGTGQRLFSVFGV